MSNNTVNYTEDHEWVSIDGDIGTIGISEHAAAQLGDVVYVDLIDAGEKIEKSEEFGSVESVKTVSGLYAPVSGEIVEINQTVIDSPETVNHAPESDAWLVKIRLSDTSELEDLMSADAYKAFSDEN